MLSKSFVEMSSLILHYLVLYISTEVVFNYIKCTNLSLTITFFTYSLEPLSSFLVVLDEEDESIPVNLDEVAKKFEEDGFVVTKIVKDGETRLVKLDFESVEASVGQ